MIVFSSRRIISSDETPTMPPPKAKKLFICNSDVFTQADWLCDQPFQAVYVFYSGIASRKIASWHSTVGVASSFSPPTRVNFWGLVFIVGSLNIVWHLLLCNKLEFTDVHLIVYAQYARRPCVWY